MDLTPQLLFGRVMHRRLRPKENRFNYRIYYLVCPLDRIASMDDGWRFGVERFGLLGFYTKDHGDRTGGDLEIWMRTILRDNDVPQADGTITLVTMPRVFGYVFNPVSFWLCDDRAGNLRAVLCEVNNTFGESHNYLCAHADRRPIAAEDLLAGEKFFHVSPFIELEGSYRFRFVRRNGRMSFHVDHYDSEDRLLLATAVNGRLTPFSHVALRRAFWRYPLVTFKAVLLIHWQAVKLLVKGVRYIRKPAQRDKRMTSTGNITNM